MSRTCFSAHYCFGTSAGSACMGNENHAVPMSPHNNFQQMSTEHKIQHIYHISQQINLESKQKITNEDIVYVLLFVCAASTVRMLT